MHSTIMTADNGLVPDAASAVQQLEAWRISFRSPAIPAGAPLVSVREPRELAAYADPIPADVTPMEHDGNTLFVLWAPPGATLAPDREKAWLDADRPDGDRDRRVIKAGIRTIQIAWAEDRAVVYSDREHLGPALDAVVRFTLAERETFDLEREMSEIWPRMKEHTPLTYGRLPRRLRRAREAEVAELTERATQMTSTLLLLQNALEQLDPTLENNAKRLYAELVLQAQIYERIELLEDPIEFAMEHYELINERMLDTRIASNELLMEATIIAVLLLEVVVIIAEYQF